MNGDLAARYHDTALDESARAALAGHGLDLRLVDADDRASWERWMDAVRRGFFDPEPTADQYEGAHGRMAGQRRTIGVYDPAAPVADTPVGTFQSWVAEVSVPGDTAVAACAISAVSVAPTHRRRGIARAMMEGELRRAADLGVPIAMLTASEATIYGRYGFAPAAAAADWTIDVTRTRWTGPIAPGRVDFVSRPEFVRVAGQVHERWRLHSPGEIAMPAGHWERFARTSSDTKDPGAVRAVQYTDTAGVARGAALYSITENGDDFARNSVTVSYLLAEDAEAYAALWRFLLEMDLIGTVHAGELSVDEPLLWMIADQRAARVTVKDHQYLRLLDVAAALEARRYGASGSLGIDVADPLGIAGGRFLLTVDDDGRGAVRPWDDDAPVDVVSVQLGIAELAAVYLGSVSLGTLARAGRVQSSDATAAAGVLSWPVAARLSFWY